jgi:serine/threonine protein kinase
MPQSPDPSRPGPAGQPETPAGSRQPQAKAAPPGKPLPTPAETSPGPLGPDLSTWQSLAGRTYGDFELLEEVGRGGMGIVYKARQQSLDRIVAFKMLLGDQFRNPSVLSRFLTEAQAAAALAHPNIVTIYQAGHCAAGHYYVMEYIEGRSLESFIRHTAVPVPVAVNVLIRVATAVHYAHTKGIVHRDLKPANIMIDRFRGPVVLDFGIAKLLGKASSVTEYGTIVGTPAFMSPEQAREGTTPVGPASDVYSLGAVLYTMLTGKLPYEGASPLAAILKVISPELPPPVRSVRPEVPVELERLCMKCLSKEPCDRPASAQELAEELRRIRATLATGHPPVAPAGEAPAPAGEPAKPTTNPELLIGQLLEIERAGKAGRPTARRRPEEGARPATPTPPPRPAAPTASGEDAPLEIERPAPPQPASARGNLPSVLLVSVANNKQVRLFKPVNVIGRAPECDLVLRAADVGKRHCQILLQGGHAIVEDLDSINGTCLNGQAVERARLEDGDRLDIAGHAFVVRFHTKK